MTYLPEFSAHQRDLVCARVPLRVSFFGGGSDLESYWSAQTGMVVAGSIDRYIDIIVRKRRDTLIRVHTNTLEVVDDPGRISNAIIRGALCFVKPDFGFDLSVMSDVTRAGSGLGSSSALIIGIVSAFDHLEGIERRPEDLAAIGAQIEIEMCRRNIGKQDFYPAAFGGLRSIRFESDGSVAVGRSFLSAPIKGNLRTSLLITDTGMRRDAGAVLARQERTAAKSSKDKILHRLVELARQFERHLVANTDPNLAEMLQESWALKSSLSGGPPDEILNVYKAGMAAGAVGAKVLGAGAGGHLLWIAPQDAQANLVAALPGLKTSPIRLVDHGVRTAASGWA